MSCDECEKLRRRVNELEGEIATIIATGKATLRTPTDILVHVPIDVETILANEFLARRIDEVDWGKTCDVRIKNACHNYVDWNPKTQKYDSDPIVTIADLIRHGSLYRLSGIGNKSQARIKEVLREHGLSFDDSKRLKEVLSQREAAA